MYLPHPSNPTPVCLPKRNENSCFAHKPIYEHLQQFCSSSKLKMEHNPNILQQVNGQTNWYIQTMKYYSAIKRNYGYMQELG